MEKLEKIKKLIEITELPMQICKKALDFSDYDINLSILWLRENKFIPPSKKDDIISSISSKYAQEWAKDFLEFAFKTGELQRYYESNNLDIIIENFFDFYIIGINGKCPYLLFKDDLKYFTEEERDDFNYTIRELYDTAVSDLLPKYIQPNWKLLK